MAKYQRVNGVYTGTSYFENTNLYYIHSHQKNIGKAENRNVSKANITSIMQSQKEQAMAATKYNYKKMLSDNISNSSIDLLNLIFESDNLVSNIDKGLKESFQKGLDQNIKQAELMQLYRNTNAKDSFVKAFDQAQSRIASFNKLLETLEKAVDLIDSPDSNALGAALAAAKMSEKGGASLTTLGQRLENAVKSFIKENNGMTFKEEQVQRAATYINYLAQGLKTGTFATSGKGLNEKSIATSVGAIFNTALGEGITTVANETGKIAIENAIVDFSNKTTNFAGTTQVASITYTPEGGMQTFNKGDTRYGKTDRKEGNVGMSIEYGIGEEKSFIDLIIDIGISNKFYSGKKFRNLDKKGSQDFEVGSLGIKLGDAIRFIYGDNFNIYLAYNVMSRNQSPEWVTQNQALQDVILKRFLLNAVSSRGGSEDFSQFIFANGNVISIWELILYAENHFLGVSHSLAKGDQKQPITLSIDGRNAISQGARRMNMNMRIRETNEAINNANMSAHIHLDKILNGYK